MFVMAEKASGAIRDIRSRVDLVSALKFSTEVIVRFISRVLVFVLTIYAVPWAQTQSLSATESLARPVLTAGTRLRVKLDSTLSTNVARPSDTVGTMVTKRIDKNGVVVLPQGTRIRGKVESVRSADRSNKVEPSLKRRLCKSDHSGRRLRD